VPLARELDGYPPTYPAGSAGDQRYDGVLHHG